MTWNLSRLPPRTKNPDLIRATSRTADSPLVPASTKHSVRLVWVAPCWEGLEALEIAVGKWAVVVVSRFCPDQSRSRLLAWLTLAPRANERRERRERCRATLWGSSN